MGTQRYPLTRVARLAISGALLGCASSGSPNRTVAAHPAAGTVQAALEIAPAAVEVRALAVPGFLPAILVMPSGVDARPLVVAAHGAGGAPEWECDYWTRLTRGRAFVLCLRGTRINRQAGYYFRHHHALNAELAAALPAARRVSSRIALGSGIYAGFSQGASMGSLVVGKYADQFPYVVLIEGFQQWNVALGRAFAERGGKAVLFACGSRQCTSVAEASRRALLRAGVRARTEQAPGAGHTAGGPVERLVAGNLAWLLGGDAAWAK